MTAYEYDNLPETLEVKPLPKETEVEALDIIQGMIQAQMEGEDSAIKEFEVKVAHVFERQGEMSFTGFGEEPNRHYQSDVEDVLLQVTIRVAPPKHFPALAAVMELDEHARDIRLEAERERLRAEIAASESAALKAQQEAEAKREALRLLSE